MKQLWQAAPAPLHLWRAAVSLLVAVGAGRAAAAPFTTLHQFNGTTDGGLPRTAVIADRVGALYGETLYGGAICSSGGGVGCGTVYRIDPTGAFTTLVTFEGFSNGRNGDAPLTLIGNTLIGSAVGGGSADLGVVFAVDTDGSHFRILHQFSGRDGASPWQAMRIGAGATLYGVAEQGGPAFRQNKQQNLGVLYSLQQDGTYTQLHDFSGGSDGGSPTGIVIGRDGTIYGTTANAYTTCIASAAGDPTCGTVYSFSPSTGQFTTLYTFTGQTDGFRPLIGSIGADGTLYGATVYSPNAGSLFELQPTGAGYQFRILHQFSPDEGGQPQSGPVIEQNGTLAGTLSIYGTNGAGSLYSFSAAGLTVLHAFDYTDGIMPWAAPLVEPDGTIVGNTETGAATGNGLVFSYGP